VIFNNGTHSDFADKEYRAERTVLLRHGEKMLFGKEKEKGLVLDGLKLKAVTVGQDGYTMDDILVHDAKEADITLHSMLAMMNGELPVAIGVIRDVEAPVYDESIQQQLEEVKSKKPTRTLNEMLMAGEIWEIK
jgi:2-oxoglutarate ferredoxin oxidoreductase subunit beta